MVKQLLHKVCVTYKTMVFQPKYKNSGDTKLIRVPIVYAELIEELLKVYDTRFDTTKGVHLMRKYISNLS
jgi:hypothetical protein